MSFAIAEALYQNVGAFHAANGRLAKDTDLTQGGIGSLLLIAQLWVGLLFTRARLLGRDVNPITSGGRWHAKIASIDPNLDSGKPISRRRHLLL
jgi:hypothetical protein